MDLPQNIDHTILGFIGAGLSIGARLGRGEKLNGWAVITTLGTGAVVGGTCTEAMVEFANLEPFWAGSVSLLLGITAMGFVLNAMDGKIPFINKFTGRGRNELDG